jgi:hypothetical protein
MHVLLVANGFCGFAVMVGRYFLKIGFHVIFMHRKGSAMPFLRHQRTDLLTDSHISGTNIAAWWRQLVW